MSAPSSVRRLADARRTQRSAATAAGLDESGVRHLLGFLLALADVPAKRVFRHHIGKPHDLGPSEFVLLVLLLDNPGAGPKQLAQSISIPPPHLTLLLDRLVARGLLARQRHPNDGRAVEVLLTPEGDALARKLHVTARAMETDWLAVLSPGEQALLRELLIKLAATGAVSGSPT